MNDEQTLNQQVQQESKGVSIVDILLGLRAHLVLILIVTLLFAVGGFVYAKVRKPVYTASVPVLFDVSGIKQVDNDGNIIIDEHGNSHEDQASNYTYLYAYLNNVEGICTSGKTIDRANVYYAYYRNYKEVYPERDINDFIKELNDLYNSPSTDNPDKTIKDLRKELPKYVVNETNLNGYRNRWFTFDTVGANFKYSANSSDTTVVFRLWVKNLDTSRAREMACIYAFAADFSLNELLYFREGANLGNAGLINLAGSVSGVSITPDMSTLKVVVIATVLGLVLAFLTVYIIYLLDNTVKSKEQLEEMSGASVIAYIDDVAEVQ
ncbi:MAG: Wzz/FepE/Etk N-terminal domain-containing protein [Christensenellaceae bacterium]